MKTSRTKISMAGVQIDEATQQAVMAVLRSGQIAQGPVVSELEKAFAAYIGVPYAIAVSSGTAALQTALTATGIGHGDEVITTPFSFIATANCCLPVGAKPVFADIDDKTFNISPKSIESKITSRTKAVICVHLYGQPCDMREIAELCRQHNLILIEDACQAHGAEYDGKKVGFFGLGCFSFYATKNLTTGEGGMITTHDAETARRARLIRNHGQSQKDLYKIPGFNFRMTDIAAAIGLGGLKNLNASNARRMKNADLLTDGILRVQALIPPGIAAHRNHVFQQYTLRITPDYPHSREELRQKLQAQGIETAVYYPIPIHQQPVYQNLGYRDHLPVAEEMARQVLSLPVHPGLSEEDIRRIVEGLRA